MNAQKAPQKSTALTLTKALGTLLPIALLALLIAALILSIFNDIYAFVKKDTDIALTVPTPCSLSEFSILLQKNEVIKNPGIFKMYTVAKGKKEVIESFSGDLELNSNMSYRQIFYTLDQQISR